MKILDVLSSPWAILPEKYQEIHEIYRTHLRGEKIDLAAVEARLGRPLKNEPKGYEIVDGVAVLPIQGVIAKRLSILTDISGGVSTSFLKGQIADALANPEVRSILLDIDSPGGAVDGTEGLAALVFSARAVKPVVAFTDGMMGSAAYWIGSAAGRVFISGDTTQVGSIGVVATHVDRSEAERTRGYKTTEIVAGRYKRIASETAPLSEEGQQYLQEMVDYVYSVFVGNVAQYRGVAVEEVLSQMADGRIFVGKQAVQVGLVDGVSTREELIRSFAASKPGIRAKAGGPAARIESKEVEEMDVTFESVAEKHPEIAEAFRQEGYAKGVLDGKVEGANLERDRIRDVEAQSMPGHDALIAELKFDGKTTGEQAAVQILSAEKQVRAGKLSAIRSDAPAPVPQPSVEVGGESIRKKDFLVLVDEWQKEHSSKRSEAIAAVAKAHPEAHRRYIEEQNR
ncbi:MAG: S49 family peptidase [bacterium]|jgi:signal peptide peptidase SppA